MKDEITSHWSGIAKLLAVVAGITVISVGCASESQDSIRAGGDAPSGSFSEVELEAEQAEGRAAGGDAPSGSFSEAVWFSDDQQFDSTLEERISSFIMSQEHGSSECPWKHMTVRGEVFLSYDSIPTTAHISLIKLGRGLGFGNSDHDNLSNGRLVLEFRDAQRNVLREKSTYISTSHTDYIPMPIEWLPEGVSYSVDSINYTFSLSLMCPPIFKYITIKWDGIELPLVEEWQR